MADDEPILYTEYGKRLRRMAETETDPERARELRLFASELELAFDKQNNVYGSATMRLDDKLEEVVHEQRKFMMDWDARGKNMDAYLIDAPRRADYERLEKSVQHAHEALSDQTLLISAGFEGVQQDMGKLSEQQEVQGAQITALATDVSNLGEEVNTQSGRLDKVEQGQAELKAGQVAIIERMDTLEARMGTLEGDVSRVIQTIAGDEKLLERWGKTQPPPPELRDE